MAALTRGRRTAVAVFVLLAATMTPAASLDLRPPVPRLPRMGTVAVGTILIKYDPTSIPNVVFVTPADADDDTAMKWACSKSSTPTLFGFYEYKVSCTPAASASGGWVCAQPYVLASYLGSSADTLEATVNCGGRTISCKPQDESPPLQNYCDEHLAGPGAMPFRCHAKFTPAALVMTTEWSAFCSTYVIR